ncbi:SAM-dependent methyltransferase [Pseudarthrobacter sp. J1738]|uniref:SAM-dependent methyltransferase n=1 Tax=Pseudarthrobacter sp. J1738 TaxID=3420446 RepID=UPI003D2B3F54
MRNNREDLRVPDAKADVYLVGLGIGGFERRTVEADEVLKECATILHLTAFHDELSSRYGAEVINMSDIYESDSDAQNVYDAMTVQFMDYAMGRLFLGPVAFVSYGHPLFLVDSSWSISAHCREAGVRAKALPGTSFIDQALIDLGERFDYGFQALESNHFFKQKITPDLRLPLLISQVGDFGSGELRTSGRVLERVQPLFDRIRALYPKDRACALFFSSWRMDMAPDVRWSTVGELDALASSIHIGSSLYVRGSFTF